MNNRIINLDKNITMNEKNILSTIKNYGDDINKIHKEMLSVTNNITESNTFLLKSVENHNNILGEITKQNKILSKEFLDVAQNVANEPGKLDLLVAAIYNVAEPLSVISDKVKVLEGAIEILQEKILKLETGSINTPRFSFHNLKKNE